MKSEKSWVESSGTLASRAVTLDAIEPERDFMGIETGGFEPGPVCFPLTNTSVGGCEVKPVDLNSDNDVLEEDRDRDRECCVVVLASSLSCGIWSAELPSLIDLLDLLDLLDCTNWLEPYLDMMENGAAKLTLASRMCSGVKVYCMVSSL